MIIPHLSHLSALGHRRFLVTSKARKATLQTPPSRPLIKLYDSWIWGSIARLFINFSSIIFRHDLYIFRRDETTKLSKSRRRFAVQSPGDHIQPVTPIAGNRWPKGLGNLNPRAAKFKKTQCHGRVEACDGHPFWRFYVEHCWTLGVNFIYGHFLQWFQDLTVCESLFWDEACFSKEPEDAVQHLVGDPKWSRKMNICQEMPRKQQDIVENYGSYMFVYAHIWSWFRKDYSWWHDP